MRKLHIAFFNSFEDGGCFFIVVVVVDDDDDDLNTSKEEKNYKWGITGLRELIEQFYGKINDPIEKMIKQTIWNDDGDLIIKPKYKINPLNGEEEMVKLSDKFLAKHIKDFERKGYEKLSTVLARI